MIFQNDKTVILGFEVADDAMRVLCHHYIVILGVYEKCRYTAIGAVRGINLEWIVRHSLEVCFNKVKQYTNHKLWHLNFTHGQFFGDHFE
jgi:hypothetical protein